MVTIYTPYPNERIRYAVYLVMQACGIKDWSIEKNVGDYSNIIGIKINYSHSTISSDELWICPHSLLFEKGIKPQNIEITQWSGCPIFFQTGATLPFDIFAASFYLVTRYEEYLPHEKDVYGRFPHTSSLAFINNFLHIPLVHDWVKRSKWMVENQFQIKIPSHNRYTYIPTYDVDIAFSSFPRLCVHKFNQLFQTKPNHLPQPFTNNPDPLNIFDKLQQLHDSEGLQPVYFFLLAQRRGKYDKNTHPSSPKMKGLIKEIAETNQIGIHPSYDSSINTKLIQQEKDCLQRLSSMDIKKSRQHYIRMSFPDTYRQLIENGIEEDYSMGYGSINGFRASYTLPFRWYDLERDEMTSLTIHPFCYMDANAIFEQKLTPEEAFEEMLNYHDCVFEHRGQFITIAHNHFLADTPLLRPWWDAYERAIHYMFDLLVLNKY